MGLAYLHGEHVIHADLLIPDAGDQTWARVRPSVALGQLPALSRFADPSVRVVLLNALRDGVRHAELSPRAALSSSAVSGAP